MGRDTNELVINVDYSYRGTERLPLTVRTKKHLRYWVEKRYGPDFTSAQLIQEINAWCESHLELPMPTGMWDDFDFDWKLAGGGSYRETEEFLYTLFKELPYIPPEVPGQESLFPGITTKVNP